MSDPQDPPRASPIPPAAGLLEATLASMAQGVIVVGRDGAILRMNASAERILGVTQARLERTSSYQERIALIRLQRPDGTPLPAAEAPALMALRGEDPRDLTLRLETARGEIRWLSVSAAPIRGAGDAILGAVSTFSDVTDQRAAEQALREGEARARRVFEHAATGIAIADWDGAFLACNPAFCRIVGHGEEELRRRHFPSLLHPDDTMENLGQVRRLKAGELPFFENESRYLRKDGEAVWVHKFVCLLPETAGRPSVMILVTDVTGRRRAEQALRESEQRFRLALRGSPVSVAAQDQELRFVWAYNQKTADPGEVLGKRDADLFRPEEAARLEALKRRVLAEGVELREQLWLDRPGGRIFLDVFFEPIRDEAGKTVGVGTATVDLTAMKLAEEALRRSEQSLREADRRKDEFLAVLSHELRNPLAPIQNSIRLLESSPREGEGAARALEVLRRQADHLARLVDDLLDVSRISHGKFELRLDRLDAREVARSAYADARDLFDQRAVGLSIALAAEPLWVDADADRLAQVVGNLLNNALKFTPAGGRVRLELARRGADGEIAVADTGIGVEPEDLERIFDSFVQPERTRGGHGGMGVGLALARELVVRMGGSIRAESPGAGGGATFRVRLPLRPAPAAAASRQRPEPVPPLRVLIVEDNEDAGETLAELLALSGHQVARVTTGQAGVRAAVELLPDVLLCDLGLPDLGGLEVVRAVRAAAPGGGPMAVALSGYAQPQDRAEALAAGFDAHLPKPPPLEELEGLLRQAARRKARPVTSR